MYQIVRYIPTYCPIYGGMNGSSAARLPMTYRSEALARKLAARWTEQSYNASGDDDYRVIPVGGSVWPKYPTPAGWVDSSADDMPF